MDNTQTHYQVKQPILAPVNAPRLTAPEQEVEEAKQKVIAAVKEDEGLIAFLNKVGFVNPAMPDEMKDEIYAYVDEPLLKKYKAYTGKLKQLGHTQPRMTQEEREATALKIVFSQH